MTNEKAEKGQTAQDVFLNTLRKKKAPIVMFLSNGIKLQGTITGFDSFSVLLKRGAQVQLIYKHAIISIMPSGEVGMSEEEVAADA